MTFRAQSNRDGSQVFEDTGSMTRVVATGMTPWEARRVTALLNEHGMSNLYDHIAKSLAVDRDTVKRVIHMANYSGGRS